MFGQLIMGPSDELDINTDDLKDFYYLCRWPDNMIPENEKFFQNFECIINEMLTTTWKNMDN